MCSLITVVSDHSDLVVKLQINDHSNQYWQYYPCIYFAWDHYQVNNYHTALANTKANTCLQNQQRQDCSKAFQLQTLLTVFYTVQLDWTATQTVDTCDGGQPLLLVTEWDTEIWLQVLFSFLFFIITPHTSLQVIYNVFVCSDKDCQRGRLEYWIRQYGWCLKNDIILSLSVLFLSLSMI